jgi:acetamidase/formamidase
LIESPDKIIAVASTRPMEDAARIAYFELINWMARDHGFTVHEAYQLLCQVGQLYVASLVNPLYTLVASIEKKYLKRCGGLG